MRKLVALSAVLVLSACTVPMTPQAVSGDRGAGTVTMAYSYGLYTRPEVDWEAADAEALRRCQAWGYTEAEPFGGQVTTCNARNGYGSCLDNFVQRQYQCTGGNNP
ncbi:MAG: YecR family lipoprotein [Pseudomonadota bacterium]